MISQFLSSVAIVAAAFAIGCDPMAMDAFKIMMPTDNSRRRLASTSLDAVPKVQLLRRDVLTASASSAAVLIAGIPMDVLAAARPPATISSYQGVYKDPNHPRGYRVLIGELNKKGMMILQDEPDGMVYNIPIQSKVDTTTGRVTLTIDFSVKSGPKDVDATLNILESRANDKATGLTFPDGNIWKRQGGVIGVYSDGFNPEYRRVIRMTKGTDLIVDLINGSKTVTVNGQAFLIGSGNEVIFDFPSKPADKGIFDKTKKTISFDDGNVWTKI